MLQEPLSLILVASSDAGVSPISAIIAALAFLNTLGIFGLIYHVGRYVGKNDAQWEAANKEMGVLRQSIAIIHNQEIMQAKTDAVISALKSTVDDMRSEMKAEVLGLRRRYHDIGNTLQRITLHGTTRGGVSINPAQPDNDELPEQGG